jgi:two-component system sensor histidine kinase HydH
MSDSKINKKSWVNIPPWIILGAVLILVPLFVLMTLQSINRQKENTAKLLVEKGAALIRSFEAGARTGMMGMRWGGMHLQRLLTETARQADIVYLLVTDVNGTILAHNDVSKIGKSYASDLDLKRLAGSASVEWRHVSSQKDSPIFEVFRQFSPTRGHVRTHHRMMGGDWSQPHLGPKGSSGEVGQIIFVGLDMEPVEAARKADARHTVLMALTLLLIGFAGIVSLFLAQAYRTTRSSLSRVKAFSDNVVENVPIGLVAIDAQRRIASFNQAAETILKAPSTELLSKEIEVALPEPLWKLIDQLKTGPRLIEKEIECPLTGGKTIPLEVIATFLQEESGVFLGHVILFRDLSEIRHLKEEIERNQRLAAVGRLAAGVAHEIRNPLSSIKGFATYFKERYREVPEDQKTAEIMIQEVERLNRVIGQLLEIARPVRIQKKPTSLRTLIRHSLKMIKGDTLEKGIRIDLNISPEIGEVLVDPDRIKQVLLNLYLNAIEAMELGGTLSVEVLQDKDSKNVQLLVSDTGTGIREQDLTHIFDPFFTTKSSGTGLGLAIVHNIIDSHRGEVRVTSRLGKGTMVRIVLPTSMEV